MTDKEIKVTEDDKIMAAVSTMWESDWFEPKEILKWEAKLAADQTWDNLKTYFNRLYLMQKKIERATAQGSRFESANHIRRRAA